MSSFRPPSSAFLLLALLCACRGPAAVPPPPPASPEEALVEVAAVDPRIRIDLRYATADNFLGRVLYGPEVRCRLRESVAQRLARVQSRLEPRGLGLIVWDGYRPLSIQREMWAALPDPRFVANPERGSRHNRGAAVDVALCDYRGRPLSMPTAHDDFSDRAARDYGGLTPIELANRELLRSAMEAEGFTGISSEWWHYDAPGWESYPIAEGPGANPR